jgi:hypothetical protein
VSVDDVAGVAILGLSARVKDPLPDQRSALVGWLPRCATRMDGRLLALGTTVVPRAALLVYAGRRAFGLLHGRLLDKLLRLAVQVPRLGCRGCGHGPQQRCGCDEHLTRAQWRVWVFDIEVGVNAIACLLAQLAHVFATRGGLSGNGGA